MLDVKAPDPGIQFSAHEKIVESAVCIAFLCCEYGSAAQAFVVALQWLRAHYQLLPSFKVAHNSELLPLLESFKLSVQSMRIMQPDSQTVLCWKHISEYDD